MQLSLFVFWALVGWCGTPWPRWWWRWPIPPPPEPDPWFIPRLIGVVGGLAGGWAFSQVFGPHPEPWTVVPAAATAVGAFVGARLLVDVYGLVKGGGPAARG